eukprot:TRINITY_DN55211_c0_g1_i1.p1 TRINITY_DN55211_c0_g1~~TRINITY_DN55211_c0_g1_i1.p1  ORF type:complete len:1309 (+),score=407.23 TRINITY_DN55211_c0_g1_i1:86-4012(+)
MMQASALLAAAVAATGGARPTLRPTTTTPCVRQGTTCRCDWWVRDHIVDYLNPGKTLNTPGATVPREFAAAEQFINGQYPGPVLECWENDDVEVNVYNQLREQGVAIHWHGLTMTGYNGSAEGGTPWSDGVHRVTQGPINPGQNYTYKFKAWPAGTHWWHSHMDTYQGDRGQKGAIVIHKYDDPFLKMYDEEILIGISDTRRVPEICLKLEGQPLDIGNPVCNEVDKTAWNGVWGNGSAAYPYAMIEVEQGKCYRLRWFAMTGNTQNYRLTVAGHNQTVIALDSYEIKPHLVGGFNLHNGERVDTIFCADQEPGTYLINATYDLACELVHDPLFSPLPPVDSCMWYAFIAYKGHKGVPKNIDPSVPGGLPQGTGGGQNATAQGLINGDTYNSPLFLDLNTQPSYAAVEPLVPDPVPHPEKADYQFWLYGGILGHVNAENHSHGLFGGMKDPRTTPLSDIGRTYLHTREGPPDSWSMAPHWPETPLLHTKAQCGTNGCPVIDIPEDAKEVELVLVNLSPSAHVFHLHGMPFDVINYGWPEWCNYENHDFCFFMGPKYPCPGPGHLWTGKGAKPHPDPKGHVFAGNCAPEICKGEVVISDTVNPGLGGGYYWGCKYNESEPTMSRTRNLKTPIRKDMISLWRHQWAVIRIRPTNPGMWLLHCHMEQHVSTGMMVVLNVLPSKQPPIPKDVPTNGPCKKWSDVEQEPAAAAAPAPVANLVVDQWVVDYRRPSAIPSERKVPNYIYPSHRQSAVLANGSFPGPAIEATAGTTTSVSVFVESVGEGTAIHWHGISQAATPWFDGDAGVTQGVLPIDNTMVYSFNATPAGTHYWRSGYGGGLQAARGLKGPLIVRSPSDPHRDLYQEEIVVSLSDVWKESEVCLTGGAGVGAHFQKQDAANFNPCPMLDLFSFDGQFGDDSVLKYTMRPFKEPYKALFTIKAQYPYKEYVVQEGRCYRMRLIGMYGEVRRMTFAIAGHSMSVIAADGRDVVPVEVSSLTVYGGERYDVVVCAKQKKGTYVITASSPDACSAPAAALRGQPPAQQCSFYAAWRYHGGLFNSSAYDLKGFPPVGREGGKSPKPAQGPALDLGNGPAAYALLKPLAAAPPAGAAHAVRLALGVAGQGLPPPHSLMYLHSTPVPWTAPKGTLYQSAAQCTGTLPVVTVPESAPFVELTVDNLTPEPQSVHIHGLRVWVLAASAPCAGLDAAACLALDACPQGAARKYADAAHPQMGGGVWWGCPGNFPAAPSAGLPKDTVPLPPRGSVLLRLDASTPGMWTVEAMSASTQLLGARTVLNIRPSAQRPAPPSVPAARCP